MSKIRKQWISREEFLDYIAGGRFPLMTIDFGNVGGLTAGSIPFANASGFLDEDNAALFWDAVQDFLGIGVGAPVCREHIRGAVCADYAGIHPDTILLVENDDHTYIQLQAADNANAGIMFADDDFNPPAGMIRYDFANDWIEFGVGTNEILQLKAGPTFDYAGTLTLAGIVTITGTNLNLQNNAEIRFYDNGNYVGFEAPALTANQIWVLPDEDGDLNDVLITDGAGNLSWSAAGAGDVTAAAVLADHTLIRGDGGAKGIQDSGIDIDDADNITFPDGASINLQENITFLGATAENLIKFPDNLPDALSFMEAGNPYQTFITTNGSEAIQFHEDVLLKGSTEYQATNKTSGAWAKSIGGGGDYADWATMIADMPDLIAHAVTVTIEAGTTLTETCQIYNKHGITSIGVIVIQAEKYYPTAGAIPTADSATATTLRDAALAAEAYGNDYFNGCWILIVDGTGTNNGFVLITDYVDATGDVVVANWPGIQPDNTSRYIIVGALVDSGAARSRGLQLFYNTAYIQFIGIGFTDATAFNIESRYNSRLYFIYCGIDKGDLCAILTVGGYEARFDYCGMIENNTSNNAAYGGIVGLATGRIFIEGCGISDNNQRGVYLRYGTFGYISANFGDGNGNWGTYCESSAQALMVGAECSGVAGNHSDPGTAGNANADQAATY